MLPVLWAQDNWRRPITAGPTGSAVSSSPSQSWLHLLRSDLCSETPGARSIRNSWQSQGRYITGYKDMKVTVSGGEVKWCPLTKKEAEQLVSIHVLICCKPGCSRGFSLSSSLYYSVQPERKEREKERDREGDGDLERTFVTLMPTVITAVCISNSVSFFRERTLHIYIETSTITFLILSKTQGFSYLYLRHS